MKDDCQQRIEKITQGFQDCQKVLTAIGDETRQVIILVLLQSDLSGKRVGQICKEAHYQDHQYLIIYKFLKKLELSI